jgi:hypothetical protein
MYTEQYLEHYADRFVELDLYSHGVTLERYLFDPAGCEFAVFELRPIIRAAEAEQASSEWAATEHAAMAPRCHACGSVTQTNDLLSLICEELQTAIPEKL